MRSRPVAAIALSIAALILAASAAADETTFTFKPPAGHDVNIVTLRGDFNEWGETPMELQEDGAWSLTLDLDPGEYQYKYYINETWPQDMATGLDGGPLDPEADGYVPDGFGGFNAVRYVGVPSPVETAGGLPFRFHETVISETEVLIEAEPLPVADTSPAAGAMRVLYELHRMAVDRGFRVVHIEDEKNAEGREVARLTFYDEAPEGWAVVNLAEGEPPDDVDDERFVLDASAFVETWDAHLESGGDRSTIPWLPGSGRVFGYSVEKDEVVFRFSPEDYEVATRHEDGQPADLGAMAIENVAVAGEFNDWSRDAWMMERVGDGVYELRRPLDDFAGQPEWQFKFVVNGEYWVEPLPGAENLVTTQEGIRNLLLKVE